MMIEDSGDLGLGNIHAPITPVITSKLYWSICVPKMTHDCEMATLSEGSMHMVEICHGKVAMAIQGLLPHTSNAVTDFSSSRLDINGRSH